VIRARPSARASTLAVVVVAACVAWVSCSHDTPPALLDAGSPAHAASDGGRSAPHEQHASGPPPREIELLPMLTSGSIDANGIVVDMGESQANAFLVPPMPISTETPNCRR
jgi:hypothetical protein